ncbi:hypothetical protein ACQJBY_071266 [Aegilops geniculata]
MGGKAFDADKLPEKEGEGWVASGWGLLKAAVGKKTDDGEEDRRRRRDERIGMDGVRIPGIKWEKDRGFFAEVVALARVAPKMVQAAAAKTIELAKAKMEEVAKNGRS